MTRGLPNALHDVAHDGSTECTASLLEGGLIEINSKTPDGSTALMLTTIPCFLRIARMLLKNGADVSMANDNGYTSLSISAQHGYTALTKVLMERGADIEAVPSLGSTPLDLAAAGGHVQVIQMFVKEGCNIDSRSYDGTTPLYSAAAAGNLQAIVTLLRAKTDPLLTRVSPTGKTYRRWMLLQRLDIRKW